ncbi:autotransporter outer membrane beta-barrel domain-containing protein [Bartonella bilalgolemii]|uniref:Autotransporter outer membrane beta-barrel domain-containing protein n=1 Tax=Bartonella bilalgolemii TaxID=2942911 RepID=A0ABT0P7L5_9HYPH|nr:autotransporter outer membrane beta-barrel domain-containing protein [Bartonella sp. G70]MCL6229455.1 autotransporter outer membrane beta-barrel domain-containing protein [Bartonella sp. G70]
MNKVLCLIVSFLLNIVCALSISLAEVKKGNTSFISNSKVAIITKGVPVVINGEELVSKYIGIASDSPKFDATGINLRTGIIGIMPAYGSRMYFKDSTIKVNGIDTGKNDHLGYGIFFGYDYKERAWLVARERAKEYRSSGKNTKDSLFFPPSQVHLTDTKILSDVGIEALGSGIVILNNSEIRSRLLLRSNSVIRNVRQNGGESDGESIQYSDMLRVNADHSVLEGQAEAAGEQYSFLTLQNGSKWIIPVISKRVVKNKQASSPTGAERQESVLHMLVLNNSAIVFDQKKGFFKNIYQTLRIKAPYSGGVAKYSAVNDANVYFNTGLNDSDKLIIEADVEGITTVHINYVGNQTNANGNQTGANAGNGSERSDYTIVEVHGHANEDSFQLAHGYTAMGGLPYKYILNTTSSKVSNKQTGSTSILKFNLKNDYVDSESQVKALVPQMAGYLVMPNALFSAGFSDINQQNASLRILSLANENNKKNAFFLSSYGNVVAFSSIRNPLQYGYGADIGYAALQTGIVLSSFESRNMVARVGLFGTYGQLSFTPKDMKDSAKSILDKYSISVFSNMQHDKNLYMNTLFSYGLVKGHIKTAVVNNVAKLDDTKMLNLSAIIGHKLATGVKGLSFEPQAQIAYQRLMFDTILDSDNLKVNMKDPSQWLVRIGGRLTKTVPVIGKNNFISYYGKMDVIKTLKHSDSIEVGDTFYLDSMGSAIEGGLGVNMQLTENILVHGDASYQQRLSKSGISGASFSGKLRYRF